MKHDPLTYKERDLTDFNVSQGQQKQNVRVREMLDLCSDEKAVLLAETIAAYKLAGIETGALEGRYKDEMRRMMTATRVFVGRPPQVIDYIKSTVDTSETVGNQNT